jgi:hypothetical protein
MKNLKYILIALICALFTACQDGDWDEPSFKEPPFGNTSITEDNVITIRELISRYPNVFASTDQNEHFSDETENHYYTYAAITARNLKAQHVVVARSGIGIYRNYGAPKSGSDDCMPRMYPYTNFMDKSQQWDFSRYQPDVVCVNLGTNDMSLNN